MSDVVLAEILKEAVDANDNALNIILENFQGQHWSAAEQEQIHYYLKKVSAEHPHAIYIRAILYDRGFGVKPDLTMSFLMMREAAAKGHGQATFEVGMRFLQGKGVTRNVNNALQWLDLAGSSPHYNISAMQTLADLYEKGVDVERDPLLAKKWRERAGK